MSCNSTNVLYATTYHTHLVKKMLLWMNQIIQRIPAGIVLLTMFV